MLEERAGKVTVRSKKAVYMGKRMVWPATCGEHSSKSGRGGADRAQGM